MYNETVGYSSRLTTHTQVSAEVPHIVGQHQALCGYSLALNLLKII